MELIECVQLGNMSLSDRTVDLEVAQASISTVDDNINKDKSCGVIINGFHTDIVIKNYRNRELLVVSQFNKFGTFITVTREEAGNSDVYTIKTLLGKDDIDTHTAARFIAEQLAIEKPLLLSICLKDYEGDTLKAITAAIRKLKNY